MTEKNDIITRVHTIDEWEERSKQLVQELEYPEEWNFCWWEEQTVSRDKDMDFRNAVRTVHICGHNSDMRHIICDAASACIKQARLDGADLGDDDVREGILTDITHRVIDDYLAYQRREHWMLYDRLEPALQTLDEDEIADVVRSAVDIDHNPYEMLYYMCTPLDQRAELAEWLAR